MNRNTKKKLIILKTLSLQESFFVVIKDYISKQDIIFNHNELDDFNKFIKDVKYVVGFDISEKITFFCKENGHTRQIQIGTLLILISK